MIYYNDGRDILGTAYWTCTSFTRYHSQPTLAGLSRRRCGVAMVIDLQSEAALHRFRLVCYGLEDSVSWHHFSFDVYDYAGIGEVLAELSRFGSITGAGELFWISGGRIVETMISDYDRTRFDAYTFQLTHRRRCR